MRLTDYLADELTREIARSRRALAAVPGDKYDWKPHEKSMIFGYLANMVATIPSWIALEVTTDELDIAPADGSSSIRPQRLDDSAALIQALDKSGADALDALRTTTDEHLQTVWHLKAGGHVVQAAPRHQMIQDTIHHWAHHRGQMTVYLRLMGARVPALYGPSADDQTFA